MSLLKVDNIEDLSAGEAIDVTYLVNNTARAQIGYNQDTSTTSKKSQNVTSVTDTGTGDCDITFTNAFAAFDYNPVCAGVKDSLSGAPIVSYFDFSSSASVLSIVVTDHTNSSSNGEFSCAVFGDLA